MLYGALRPVTMVTKLDSLEQLRLITEFDPTFGLVPQLGYV